MSLDGNDSVARPSIKKKPSSSNRLGNLVKLSALGLLGLGTVVLNAIVPVNPGHAVTDVIVPIVAHERTANCTGSSCLSYRAYATIDGTLTVSGANVIVMGKSNNILCMMSSGGLLTGTNCAFSGASITVNKPTAGSGKLSVNGSLGSMQCWKNTAGSWIKTTMVGTTLTNRAALAGECP